MATVRIAFDGGNVPVITGAEPPAKDVPIANPAPAGGNTNSSFLAQAGVSCYGLKTSIPHTPLWQLGNVIDGVPLHLSFKKMAEQTDDSTSESGSVERLVEAAGKSAPEFRPIRTKLRYQQAEPTQSITERKRVARERCNRAKQLVATRANAHPELKALIDQYDSALSNARKDRGGYRLFIAGLEIEAILRASARAPKDETRNPKIDADLLLASESLIVANAGLVSLFPDLLQLGSELDRYRQQADAVDALKERILDPVMKQLAATKDLFDPETQTLTQTMGSLDEPPVRVHNQPMPTQGVTAAKHAWLRGILSAIGSYLLKQMKAVVRVARDTLVKDLVSGWMKNPDALSLAMLNFLRASSDQLIALGTTLQSGFGWLRALLSMLGLG